MSEVISTPGTCHHMYYQLKLTNRWTYEIYIDERTSGRRDGVMDCVELTCEECGHRMFFTRLEDKR